MYDGVKYPETDLAQVTGASYLKAEDKLSSFVKTL